MTRRRFLATAGAATLAASLPRTARASGQHPRIAIIGAGISGLTTALTLADAGIASTVYEASGRIGGRMHSNTSTWKQGQTSEWCGELIDTIHETVLSLADRFQLSVLNLHDAEPAASEDTYFFQGRYYPYAQAVNDFAPVFAALADDNEAAGYPTTFYSRTEAGIRLDHMSVHEWIEARVPGGHASSLGQLLDVAYTVEYGADTCDQSALNLVYLLGTSPEKLALFGESDETFHIEGGNQQLPAAIAQHLGGDRLVRLGMELRALRRTQAGGYELTFDTRGGTRAVEADLVVLALPFAVLRHLDYARAGFDALKHRAIQQLGRGRSGKLQLQFDARIWNARGPWPGVSNGSSYADTGYQNTWDVTRAQPGASGILVDYTGGSVTERMTTQAAYGGIQTYGVHQDASRFLHQLERVYPGIAAHWNGLATSSLPFLDPNLRCSYSYWGVGQYTGFSGYEGVRQGNVFFTGEHTSQDFQGYMEGGASEGIRAANEILAQLRI